MVLGILGGDAALHGHAAGFDLVLLRNVQRRLVELTALRDEDLRFHQVDARDHFGDGVLDLNARIDFDEIKLAGIDVEEEFDRAGRLIFDRFAKSNRRFADSFAKIEREIDSRRDLDHFLMPPLHGAIPLPEMD